MKPCTTLSKEKGSSEAEKIRVENSMCIEENNNTSNNKYPSKLHEKLAFLEGKVKRIATDIKKTKEMLDMNNPDESKVILSDIHEKISGIEKAMVRVVSNDDNENGDKQLGVVDEAVKSKSLVKGLNSEELEARLFPHDKLLRDRTLINKDSVVKAEEKVLSPVDDNSVALEFLASLDKGKVSACIEVGGGNSEGKGSSWNHQKCDIDMVLEADEKLEEFDDDQENKQQEGEFVGEEETDEAFNFKLNGIGTRTASAGWFVSEGEAVLLAHDDASCSYYDIANCEVYC